MMFAKRKKQIEQLKELKDRCDKLEKELALKKCLCGEEYVPDYMQLEAELDSGDVLTLDLRGSVFHSYCPSCVLKAIHKSAWVP